MFHDNDLFVKNTSSIGAEEQLNPQKGLIALLVISSISCFLILVLLFRQSNEDPYIKKSLNLIGSKENGSQLFRMNCVGCHGISAQGLVGPELNNVTNVISDKKIIQQIIRGLTPPMPSFEMDPQSMADLIEYLHSLSA